MGAERMCACLWRHDFARHRRHKECQQFALMFVEDLGYGHRQPHHPDRHMGDPGSRTQRFERKLGDPALGPDFRSANVDLLLFAFGGVHAAPR